MHDTNLDQIAEAQFGYDHVLCTGYVRLYQAKPDQEFKYQGIEGVMALVRHVSSTNQHFYNIYIMNYDGTITWATSLTSYGEQSFQIIQQDCLVFDGFDQVHLLQFSSMEDCE